jgi:hypothetical protein
LSAPCCGLRFEVRGASVVERHVVR